MATESQALRSFFSLLSRTFENEDFLKSVTALVKKARCKLTICSKEQNMEDRWMQVRGPAGQAARDMQDESPRGPRDAWGLGL